MGRTPRQRRHPPKSPKTSNPHILNLIAAQKGLEGVWGNLSSKGSPKKQQPNNNLSPLFAEISQTERSRGLGFALAAHADYDENEDSDEVGDHLVEGLGAFDVGCAEEFWEEVVEPLEEAEEVGAPDGAEPLS